MHGVAESAVSWSTPRVTGETNENPSYLACLQVVPSSKGLQRRHTSWFSACYRLTPDVERVSPRCALLNLGRCSQQEALAVMDRLLEHLKLRGFHVQAGIGPSLTLAQLAMLTAFAGQPLLVVPPSDTRLFLRRVPVTLLLQMHPQGRVTPEIIERLQRYGLHTVGHLARLGELALHRQFGSAGTFLARVAAGQDDRPLHPTPRPARYRIRLRFGSAAPPEQVLEALGRLSERVATGLRQQGRQARVLRVRLRWETGAVARARLSLRQYTNDPAVILQSVRRLLLPLLGVPEIAGTPAGHERDGAPRAQEHAGKEQQDRRRLRAVEELRLILEDFAPASAQQATFWRTDEQRWSALQIVAESLARRHQRPLLLHGESVRPAAIFSEERYRLTAIGAPGTERKACHMHMPQHGEAPANPWQAVPRRLHWW